MSEMQQVALLGFGLSICCFLCFVSGGYLLYVAYLRIRDLELHVKALREETRRQTVMGDFTI